MRARGFAKLLSISGLLVLAVPAALQATPPARPSELSSALADVAAARQQGTTRDALEIAKEQGVDVRGDELLVLVQGNVHHLPGIKTSLRSLGARVQLSLRGTIQARLPVAALDAAAAAPGVELVREARRMRPLAVAGEGVGTTNAPAWHRAGWTGTGVKIGIIDSFAGYQLSQSRGDLSASAIPVDLCPSIGGFPGPDDHGTAVGEIVHEMAPGAQLYLLCAGTEVEFAAAILFAIDNGIPIVNCSCGFFNVGRGDGTGTDFSPDPGAYIDFPDLAVEAARSSNILPVFAAGNSRQQHWSGTFSDPDANATNNFSGADEAISVTIQRSGPHCFFLKWDDWPRPTQDFDFYVYGDLAQPPLATSAKPQNGAVGQTPTEEFCPAFAGPGLVQLVIKRSAGTLTPRFDLFSVDADLDEYITAGSLAEPADSPYAMAAGAVCWQNRNLEDFSSVGPTIDGRVKPDLVGPDRVSSGVYGAFLGCAVPAGFAGTSAPAPHVAAAAALVKQAFPGFTADQLQSFLETNAIDQAPAGKDNLTGAGLLSIGAAPSFPPAPPAVQSRPPPAPQPASVPPATLKKLVAIARAKKALRQRYGRRFTRSSARRVACKRASPASYRCSFRFTYKRKRYRGTVVVTRRANGSIATRVKKR